MSDHHDWCRCARVECDCGADQLSEDTLDGLLAMTTEACSNAERWFAVAVTTEWMRQWERDVLLQDDGLRTVVFGAEYGH